MNIGRTLMLLGGLIFVVGLLFALGERSPLRLGRLPGDVVLRGKHTVFYFPLVTSIVLSVVLSLLLWLFNRR